MAAKPPAKSPEKVKAPAKDLEPPQDAASILEGLFNVVLEEARARPAFAKKLLRALPKGSVVNIETPRKAKKRAASFDPTEVNPVVIIRNKGETALKFELGKRRTKKELLAIIRVHNLDVEARIKRSGTLSDLRQAIIEAASQRIERDRAAAS